MQKQSNKYDEVLSAFFRKAKNDSRLTPVHISLYFALYRFFQRNNGINPIAITRRKLMKYAHIKSTATYTKCIYDLQTFGYLTYEPSYHPAIGSSITLHTAML